MAEIFHGGDFGITAGKDVAVALNALLAKMETVGGKKTLVLEKGVYYLDSDNVPHPELYVTNSIGDDEWKKSEEQHINAVGVWVRNVSDFTLDGGGSTLVIRGQMTNMALSRCDNVTVRNLSFVVENPDMHELEVTGKGGGYVDFRLNGDSRYVRKGRQFFFVGKNYAVPFVHKRFTAHWIGRIPADDSNCVRRVGHPFARALGIKEIAQDTFRVRYFPAPACKPGDIFCLFDVRRKYHGIFVERCRNVVLENVAQHFNYGLATVFQDSENVAVRNCRFAPEAGSGRKMASVADFMQVCMCRGKIEVENNLFEGAGDDCLNVHGVHFHIAGAAENRLILRFMHRQTHGFCPFRTGDEVRYIDEKTLLPVGSGRVTEAESVDEYTLRLRVDGEVPADTSGKSVENASACPDVTFSGNVMSRIITRGVLITTSGKVSVKGNCFENTSMHSVLIADDASSWYESGFVRDVKIDGNYFGKCKGYTLMVKPENRVHRGYVHSNITFCDNVLDSDGEGGFYFKSVEGAKVFGNKIQGKCRKTVIKRSSVEITEKI